MSKLFELTPEYIEKLRQKLVSDSTYAETLLQLMIETEEITLKSVWVKAEFPYPLKNDPKAMIAMLTGYHTKTKKEVIAVLLDNRENIRDLSLCYPTFVWKQYNPVLNSDFKKLPDVYPILFEMNRTDCHEKHLFHFRMLSDRDENPIELDTGVKFNLINTNADSEIMHMLFEI